MTFYLVGGAVRDEIMGFESKDLDYAVDIHENYQGPVDHAYEMMNFKLKEMGFEIFLETPNCFTTRAKFPKDHKHAKQTADFVLCRKEIYTPGSRIPYRVEVGTLLDDLKRRDFTANAVAKDLDTGEIIDPFMGITAIKHRVLKCPVNANTSFNDDPLRLIRALRFKITKGFSFDTDISVAIREFPVEKMDLVSDDRIREEFSRMFKHSTYQTLSVLFELKMNNPKLFSFFFRDIEMWLKPTNEKR